MQAELSLRKWNSCNVNVTGVNEDVEPRVQLENLFVVRVHVLLLNGAKLIVHICALSPIGLALRCVDVNGSLHVRSSKIRLRQVTKSLTLRWVVGEIQCSTCRQSTR